MTTESPTAVCPMCREEIQPDARKCRHCGEILDPSLRKSEPGKQAISFVKLLIALAAIVVVVIIWKGIADDLDEQRGAPTQIMLSA